MALIIAIQVEQVHIERFPEGDADDRRLSVSYEKDGVSKEAKHSGSSLEEIANQMGMPPTELWERIVRRLKVMAQTVDNGPHKSVDGQIDLRMSKNRTVTFHMTTKPNPHSDNKVTLVYKSDSARTSVR